MGRMMSPDPSGLMYADPTNPQSFNLYSYVLNNPLTNVDPDGLKCFQVDGDGNLTGGSNAGDCATDSNGNPTNNDIYVDDEKSSNAFLDSNGDLLGYTNGSGQEVGADGNPFPNAGTLNADGSGTPLNDIDTEISPFAMQFIQGVATDTASMPWLCNASVSFQAQVPKTPLSIGLSADRNGINPSLKATALGPNGGASFTTNGKNLGFQIVAPVTPFINATVSTGKNQATVGASKKYNFGPGKVSAGASLTFGYLGDSHCR
jgi:hypothetical protein